MKKIIVLNLGVIIGVITGALFMFLFLFVGTGLRWFSFC